MATYVIGDTHGCFVELQTLLVSIEEQDNNASFIFTGDLLDRGKGNVDMASWAIEHIAPNGKYRSVCGNHDAGIADWVKDNKKGYVYPYQYGTEYDFHRAGKLDILDEYAKFAESLPLYIEKEVNGQIFVVSHGYIPNNYKDIDPFEKNEDARSQFYWDRSALYGAESPIEGTTLICGHNPVILPEWIKFHPNHEICTAYVGKNLVNVDTGCFHSGLLSAYCLDTGVVFYNDVPGIAGFKKRRR